MEEAKADHFAIVTPVIFRSNKTTLETYSTKRVSNNWGSEPPRSYQRPIEVRGQSPRASAILPYSFISKRICILGVIWS